MKRVCLLAALTVLSQAQTSRENYRAAYKAWWQTDPDLEREAAEGGAPIAQRADRLAAEAAKFAAARKTFIDALAQDEGKQISWLENSTFPPQPAAISTAADMQFMTLETAGVTRTMDTFANDPDTGIQQLRQALARERAALEALSPAIARRKKAADTVTASMGAMEQSRAKAVEQAKGMLEALKSAAEDAPKEGAAWAEYYRKVGEGAQGEAAPITEVQPGAEPAVLNNPIAAPPTITPLPLARYVGGWAFPAVNGLYHGPQPEVVDLEVLEEDGHVKGTMVARFKLPSGSKEDPVVRFDFSGDVQPTKRQVFNLVTAEEKKGTIELIPGPAFNLLEINFQTEPNPGKIRQADVLLLKK